MSGVVLDEPLPPSKDNSDTSFLKHFNVYFVYPLYPLYLKSCPLGQEHVLVLEILFRGKLGLLWHSLVPRCWYVAYGGVESPDLINGLLYHLY